MSMTNLIGEILEKSVNAPSGDNSQPWTFAVEGSVIFVFNVVEGDSTLYNYKQRGSYLAHGALAENIVLTAAASGFRAEVEPFPGLEHCTAKITLSPVSSLSEPLAQYIEKRTTNRKVYRTVPLEGAHRDAIMSVTTEQGVSVRLLEDSRVIPTVAGAISTNERLLMENRQLHDFLFSMIRWSKRDERTRPGLYLKTMEFPLPVQIFFRTIFRPWFMVRALNIIGLSTSIPKQSAQGYAASSAFGAVTLKQESDTDFFNAGRVFERIWLTAAGSGLSLQPVTAIPYLAQRVRSLDADAFTGAHQQFIRDAYEIIHTSFDLQESEHIAMLFRIGYGDPPTAHSHKAAPIIRSQ